MKEKTSIAAPLLWTVVTIVWIVNLCLHTAMKHGNTLLILNALCVALGFLQTVVQWRRYQRTRTSEDAGSKNL